MEIIYIYGEVKELIPDDPQIPLGYYVRLTNYVDNKILHDHLTNRSITAIPHLVNKTQVDWYSNKHCTMVTATYYSGFFLTINVWNRLCIRGILFYTLV